MGALALPATAAARPIQDPPITPSPSQPRTVTVVQHSDNTLPIAVASAALLVAMASAGLVVTRRAPVPRVES